MPDREVHLVVFVHGLWGTREHMSRLHEALLTQYNSSVQSNSSSKLSSAAQPNPLTEPGSQENSKNGGLELVVYSTHSFEFYYTYDGIDVCGTRVASEIEAAVDEIENGKENRKVTKLSVVGYSLGGLVARYCVGLLYKRGFFDKATEPSDSKTSSDNKTLGTKPLYHPRGIEPALFTTFATPHVGVLQLGTGLLSKMYNSIAPYILSYTSRQLCLVDLDPNTILSSDPGSGSGANSSSSSISNATLNPVRPLLEVMADPASPFYKSLSLFKARVLYANILNDHRTEWYTSGISSTDPYSQFGPQNVVGPYIDRYAPVLLDTRYPLLIAARSANAQNVSSSVPKNPLRRYISQITSSVVRALSITFKVAKVLVVAPIWFVAFLANVGYQTGLSVWRKKRFVGTNTFLTFSQALRHDQENSGGGGGGSSAVNGSINGNNGLVGSGNDDLDCKSSSSETGNEPYSQAFGLGQVLEQDAGEAVDSVLEAVYRTDSHNDFENGFQNDIQDSTSKSVTKVLQLQNYPYYQQSDQPDVKTPSQLNLSSQQLEIIDNLNSLNWIKYPVHISKAAHSHAAIVVRYENKDFDEGTKVIDHWVKNVFEL